MYTAKHNNETLKRCKNVRHHNKKWIMFVPKKRQKCVKSGSVKNTTHQTL